MTRWFRLVLMCLLAVALPLQGVAAATMISCGLGQHDHASAHMTAHGHAATERHHDGEAVTSAHAHESGTALAADADDSHSGNSSHSKGSLHKCSACASCCVGAAVPSQAVSFATVKLTDIFAPLAARSVPAYVAEGLERPPRAFPV